MSPPPCKLTFDLFDLESGVRVTCDVGCLCANFSLTRPLQCSRLRPNSRTERSRKTKIGAEIANVTRDSDTTFKVKRLKVKVTRPLYSARP